MKINTIKFNKKQIIPPEKDREVKGLIITVALFASGMIIGSGLYNYQNNNITDILNNVFFQNIHFQNYSVFHSLINEIIVNIFFLALIFFSGISCAGIPVIILTVFIKGMSTGMLAGFLFSSYSINGICYYLITILPAYVFLNACFLISANNSYFLSWDITSIIMDKMQPDKSLIKGYIIKMCPMLLFSIIASLISIFLKKAFNGLFSF